jgi:hypothetical protein
MQDCIISCDFCKQIIDQCPSHLPPRSIYDKDGDFLGEDAPCESLQPIPDASLCYDFCLTCYAFYCGICYFLHCGDADGHNRTFLEGPDLAELVSELSSTEGKGDNELFDIGVRQRPKF